MSNINERLDAIGQEAIAALERKHEARERALPRSRTAIRFCANSIRAIHRQEFQTAEGLLAQAGALVKEMADDLREHQDIFFAGFVQDAQKEFAEASTLLALTQSQLVPTAPDLGIGWAPYLNGLGEAVGELRRYVLDQLRRGNFGACEPLLQQMDDIYAMLTTVDFPDAITLGLRRTTDSTRGILEKTRGDLTTAVSQAQLQQAMLSLQHELRHAESGDQGADPLPDTHKGRPYISPPGNM